MKKFTSDQLRNVGLFSHGGAGKTTLAEAILFHSGAVDRMGKVEDGNTATDFDPDEIKRKNSIYLAMAPCEWKNNKINIIDTPGFIDFVAEVHSALRVIEGAVMVASAVSGVEVGLEKVWDYSEKYKLPAIMIVNKMDKENANFYKTLDELQKLSPSMLALHLPIGSAENFTGLIDLLEETAYTFDKGAPKKTEIPKDIEAKVKEYREKLMEAAAESSDELITKYLDQGEISVAEMKEGIKKGVRTRKIVPVLCSAAFKNMGIPLILDSIVEFIPSPAEIGEITGKNLKTGNEEKRKTGAGAPLSALVFKTTADPYVGKLSIMRVYSGTLKADSPIYNSSKEKEEKLGSLMISRGKTQENVPEVAAGDIVTVSKLESTVTGDTLCAKESPIVLPGIDFPEPVISMAVFPKSKGDEDKLGTGLARIAEEDPTFVVRRDTETKETIVSGMGELHIEIAMDRLKRKFGVDVTLATPKIPYKETIKSKVQVEGKHKKQSGGRGQYGHCWLELEPLEKGKNFEFVDKIVGGAIPRNFIPSVEKGVRKAMEEGSLAGYPLVDVRVKVYDGSYHTVDSSDIAFQIAGSMALRKGVLEATPILLEPIMEVEVIVPEQFMGDTISSLNGKRGRILGMEPYGRGQQLIKAQVPLAEMQRYSIDLRSITQGKGNFKMKFSYYEEVPHLVAEPIIAAAKKEKE